MFTYHYRRYMVPDHEAYESLMDLFQRAWSDMEYETAYPERVTVGDTTLIEQAELIDLTWYQAPSDDFDALAPYFADVAARYNKNSEHQTRSPAAYT